MQDPANELRRIPLPRTRVNKTGWVKEFGKPPSPHGQPGDSGELLPVLGRPATDSGAGPKRLQAMD